LIPAIDIPATLENGSRQNDTWGRIALEIIFLERIVMSHYFRHEAAVTLTEHRPLSWGIFLAAPPKRCGPGRTGDGSAGIPRLHGR